MRRTPPDSSSGPPVSSAEPQREEFALRLVRCLPRLRRHALRRVGVGRADDLVQESLVRALQSAASYDGGRSVWPWLRSVAGNVAVRQAEREARAPVATDDFDGTAVDAPDERDDAREEAVLLIDHLRGPEREALERHYLGGESIAAIASATGAAVGTVKARLSRGRRRLMLLVGVVAGAVIALFALNRRGTSDAPRPPRIFHASVTVEHFTPAKPQFARKVIAPQSTNGWRVEGARLYDGPVESNPNDIETGRLESR